ncbi:hypothetical protein X922_25670 [Pseudomonas aeruginosa VRFPA08]|nr:hypothetical protein X922_25670 [Pseudomonas aeruginosa VRFPA08]
MWGKAAKRCGGDIAVEDRMPLAGQADEAGGEQLLGLDLGLHPGRGADVEVDAVLPQGFVVYVRFWGKAQGTAWRFLAEDFQYAGGQTADQGVVGTQGEAALQLVQLDGLAGVEQVAGLVHQLPDLLLQFQGAGRGHQLAAGADHDRVAYRLADPRQGTAHRRWAEVHAARGSDHAALFEKNVEGDQEIHIGKMHGVEV